LKFNLIFLFERVEENFVALILIIHTLRTVVATSPWFSNQRRADEHNVAYTWAHDGASVFLSPPPRQRTQSDVAVFGTVNVDSEHICLAMEERSLQGVGGARARGAVQILCRFIEHTVAIKVALFWFCKKEKNSSGIDVKMNGSFYFPPPSPRFSHVRFAVFNIISVESSFSLMVFFRYCPWGEFVLLFPTFTFFQKNNTGKITIATLIMANNIVIWTNHMSKLLAEKWVCTNI